MSARFQQSSVYIFINRSFSSEFLYVTYALSVHTICSLCRSGYRMVSYPLTDQAPTGIETEYTSTSLISAEGGEGNDNSILAAILF